MKTYYCYKKDGETITRLDKPENFEQLDNNREVAANSETIARMTFETKLKLEKNREWV